MCWATSAIVAVGASAVTSLVIISRTCIITSSQIHGLLDIQFVDDLMHSWSAGGHFRGAAPLLRGVHVAAQIDDAIFLGVDIKMWQLGQCRLASEVRAHPLGGCQILIRDREHAGNFLGAGSQAAATIKDGAAPLVQPIRDASLAQPRAGIDQHPSRALTYLLVAPEQRGRGRAE